MPAPKGNTYAIGNKGGRPTKMPDNLIELTKEYLASCQDDAANKKVSLPTVAGLSRWLNVSRDTIYAWTEENKEFSDTVEQLRSEQEKRLIENGLAGTYNPTIAKLILSSKYDYREKSETDITSGGKPIPIYGGKSIDISGHDGDQKDIQPQEAN